VSKFGCDTGPLIFNLITISPMLRALKTISSWKGKQHYWVHVAIDGFTGQVIDKQIEVVNE